MRRQIYRNSTIFENYEKAVEHIQHILVHDKSIVDGQEILARYKYQGNILSLIAVAYVNFDGSISFSIINDGMSIISSDVEPSLEFRDNYIWLQETDDSTILDDGVTYDLRSMQRAIAELYRMVDKFSYAFEKEMNCGKVTDNSTRLQLMSEAEPSVPMGFEDGTTPFLLSSFSDGEIEEIITYFKANDSFDTIVKDETWETDIVNIELSNVMNVMWVYKHIKYIDGREVDTTPMVLASYVENKYFQGYFDYYKLSDDSQTPPDKKTIKYIKEFIQPTIEHPYLYCYVECDYAKDINENKPKYYENSTPNVKHLIIKSASTEQEIKDNILNLCDNELVWCEGNNGLYIRSQGKIIKINGGISSGGNNNDNNDNNNDNIGDIMAGIITSGDYISSIDFISKSNKTYRMKVNDYGKMEIYTSNLDEPDPTIKSKYKPNEKMETLFQEKLYINSFYCGGDGDEVNEHSLRPCSHNFVELSNLTNQDINLNGFSLQYATQEGVWEVLPLWGIIPSNGTFLIRGAQCSLMDANTTVLKVTDFDMEWYVTKLVNGINKKELIKFNSSITKLFLTYGEETSSTSPYSKNTDGKFELFPGYVDYVGAYNGSGAAPSAENKPFKNLSTNYLVKKYYAMDGVKQATKELAKRNNANDLCYVDLTRDDVLPHIENYTPKSSKGGKNFFYDKSQCQELQPTIVSMSFGIQATDNIENGGSGATRCFNWVSKGYYNEFIWYKKINSEDNISNISSSDVDKYWTCIESYYGQANESYCDENGQFKNSVTEITHGYPTLQSGKYYHRIQFETSNGELCTSHKVILRNLTEGQYVYICGKKDKNGLPLVNGCSDIRSFIVRTDNDVNSGFTFVHTSDQQGFNWDEYQVWYYSAKCIAEKDKFASISGLAIPQFTINTGDATQNGNRMNEWIDYFNGREPLKNLEEMYTIGNNDLCPATPYQMGGGNDIDKINPINITYFYTFELDEFNLPLITVGESQYYIPSLYSFNYGNTHFLCVNSEIAPDSETKLYGLKDSGNLYSGVKLWCENDMRNHSGKTNGWNIAYCHEMPFTILTEDALKKYYSVASGFTGTDKTLRGGSRLNTNAKNRADQYWFSKLCQNCNIRLVMGGHKHTQAITWPLIENDNKDGHHNMQPTIQVTSNDLFTYFSSASSLNVINDSDFTALNGKKYPSTWCDNGKIKEEYKTQAHYCEFELVSAITAPIYAMSQATGYKHTSNKELPAANIPWCRYYYPNTNGSANTNQTMPFFTFVTVVNGKIELNVKRINNLMNGGKFNIYSEGEKVKKNFTNLVIQNGIAPGYEATNTQVIIEK